MSVCKISDCGRDHYARGLCKRHYQQERSAGRLADHARALVQPGATLDERLRHHGWTVTPSGCWEWAAALNGHGYGQLAAGLPGSKPMIASRAAYEAWIAPLEPGDVVCHSCDHPPCINPEHLFVGDKAANNRDMAEKRRTANGEIKSSHRLSDAQVEEIRTAYAVGDISQKALAAAYGVSQQLVSGIIRHVRRRELTYWR